MVFAFLVLAAAMVLAGSGRQYWIRQSEAGVRALWHDNEAFIVLAIQTVGRSETRAGRARTAILAWLSPDRVLPESLRPDLVLYRFDGKELSRHDVPGASTASGFVPYRGVLHRSVGGNPPRTWRWNGTTFELLSESEQREFRDSSPSSHELFRKEGWSYEENLTPFQGREKAYPIKLDDQELLLKIIKAGDDREAEVSKRALVVTLTGKDLPETILHEYDQSWRRVDSATYSALSRTPDGPDGGQMRLGKKS